MGREVALDLSFGLIAPVEICHAVGSAVEVTLHVPGLVPPLVVIKVKNAVTLEKFVFQVREASLGSSS
jgi:hypothetical protein